MAGVATSRGAQTAGTTISRGVRTADNLGCSHLTDGQHCNLQKPPPQLVFLQSLLYFVVPVRTDYSWVKTVVLVLLQTENNEMKKVQLPYFRYDYKASEGKHIILN